MQLSTSLAFDGRCEAAFKYYEQHLGGKIEFLLTWGDSPMATQAPVAWHGKVLHATLRIGGTELTGTDVPGYERQSGPRGFSISLRTSDPAVGEGMFRALAEGGMIDVPLQETFWAQRYGMVTDQFGIPWEINCGPPSSGAEK